MGGRVRLEYVENVFSSWAYRDTLVPRMKGLGNLTGDLTRHLTSRLTGYLTARLTFSGVRDGSGVEQRGSGGHCELAAALGLGSLQDF